MNDGTACGIGIPSMDGFLYIYKIKNKLNKRGSGVAINRE